MLIIMFVFLSNFAIVSFWVSFHCDKFYEVNINAAGVVFEFENRVPVFVGSALGNVNKVLNGTNQVNFSRNGTDYDQLFVPVEELSKPRSINSPIADLTHQLFPSSLCEIV